ncbi:MAG: PHP domain-containing protein [Ignavibacteria bacterium]
MFEYVGAIHIHSVFSDGSGEVSDIGAFADEAGLDYILLTDHNTLRALKEGYEGWYGKTLVLAGCEINDKENKNHYLAFNIQQTFSTRMPVKEIVRKVNEAGGIGFLAHPHEKRSSMKEHPAYPWTDWSVKDFTGIEIWNHMSEWMEGLTVENKYQYFIHPLRSVVAPPAETLAVWDELNQHRRVVGIGGVDAHAHKINLLGFFEVEVFPYKVLFKSIRTHILTNEKIEIGKSPEAVSKAGHIIYGALKEGRCFISNSYRADAGGFRFFADNGEKKFQMGEEVMLYNKVKLRVMLPSLLGEIRLIRNGELYDSVASNEAEFHVKEPGAYRAEVYLDKKPWIYSNHIRVTDSVK